MTQEKIFKWNDTEHDRTPRYAPTSVMVVGHGIQPVIETVYWPVGMHPAGNCPIRWDMGVLELVTPYGSRFYGCESAVINSELRMVVMGCDKRDEVRMAWTPARIR